MNIVNIFGIDLSELMIGVSLVSYNSQEMTIIAFKPKSADNKFELKLFNGDDIISVDFDEVEPIKIERKYLSNISFRERNSYNGLHKIYEICGVLFKENLRSGLFTYEVSIEREVTQIPLYLHTLQQIIFSVTRKHLETNI